jgi:hypothetical protein
MTSTRTKKSQGKILFSKQDRNLLKIKELQILREITVNNLKLGRSTVTMANPKLFIREEWLKGRPPRTGTHLEILALVPTSIITKPMLTPKANSERKM